MKKLIFLLAVSAFTINTYAGDKFQLGVKAGFNSTHFTTDNYDPTGVTISNVAEDAKSGYSLGVYGRLPITERLRFQPELYYISKNGSSDFTRNNVFTESDIEIQAWDIPLLLNYSIINLKVADIYVIGGPAISFLGNPLTTNLNENYKSAAWNFQAGVGVEIWKFNLDTRYEWGLSDLSEGGTSKDGVPYDLTRKSNSFQINLSYQLF